MGYTGSEELDIYTFGFDVRGSRESGTYTDSCCHCFDVKGNVTPGPLFYLKSELTLGVVIIVLLSRVMLPRPCYFHQVLMLGIGQYPR